MTQKEPSTVKANLYGIGIGGVLAALTTYVSLKTGLMLPFLPLVAILGFVLMRLFGSYSKVENNISMASASGCIIAIYGTSGAIVALILFEKGTFSPAVIILGIALSVLASLLGVLISYYTREQWIEKEQLAFPGGTAAAILINSLGEVGGRQFKVLTYGFLTGFILYLITNSGVLPSNPFILVGLPAFIGIEISALAFGLGYIIGWRPSALVFVGSVYSVFVWGAGRGAATSFNTHLFQPSILSVGAALLVAASLISLVQMRQTGLSMMRNTKTRFISLMRSPPVVITVVLVCVIAIYLRVSALHIHPLIGIASAFFAVVAGIFCIRSAGETGILPAATIGMLMLIVAALLMESFASVLFLAALVTQVGIICGFTMSNFKAGEIVGAAAAKLAKSTFLGAVVGAPIGLGVLMVLFSAYGFGTENLPSPGPVIWGATVQAIIEGGSEVIKASYAFGASIVALVLSFFNLSAVSVGIGTIIPPSISGTMGLGGLCSLIVKKRTPEEKYAAKQQEMVIFSSGLITGEGIAIIALVLLSVVGIL